MAHPSQRMLQEVSQQCSCCGQTYHPNKTLSDRVEAWLSVTNPTSCARSVSRMCLINCEIKATRSAGEKHWNDNLTTTGSFRLPCLPSIFQGVV